MNLVSGEQTPLQLWQARLMAAIPMKGEQAFNNPAIAYSPSPSSETETIVLPRRQRQAFKPSWPAFRSTSTPSRKAFANPALAETKLAEAEVKHSGAKFKFFERQSGHSRVSNTEQAVDWFEHAQAYFTTGQFNKAWECAEQALSFDVQNASAWQLCGAALMEMQRFAEAQQAFQHVVTMHPKDGEGWLGLGRVQMQRGYLKDALQSFKQAAAYTSENATVLLYQARTYVLMQQFQQACELFARVVDLKSEEPDCWRAYGEALTRNSQPDQALECFETVTQLQPDDADNWVRLGSLLRELGRSSEAVISFNIALELAPNDFFIWYSRGLALSDLGQHDQAAKSYQRALEFNLTDPAAQYHLALSYLPRFIEALKEGHVFNAKELWQKAVKLGRQAGSADWLEQETDYLQMAAELGHQRLVKVLISRIEGNELLKPLQYVLDLQLTNTPLPNSLSASIREQIEALLKRISPPACHSLAAIA